MLHSEKEEILIVPNHGTKEVGKGYIIVEMEEAPSADFAKFKERFSKRVANYHKKIITVSKKTLPLLSVNSLR